MITPSDDGCRLTAHLEPGGWCIAAAERQPDGRWLVNGRAMSREHADIALEAAVTVAAASQHPRGAAQASADVRLTEAYAASSAATTENIRQLTVPADARTAATRGAALPVARTIIPGA